MSPELPQTKLNEPIARRAPHAVLSTLDLWQSLKESLTAALASPSESDVWSRAVVTLAARIRALALQDPDLALYMLLQWALTDMRHYSSHHAMFAAVVADLCAIWLEWPPEEASSLFHAALTMNVSMASLQNQLAAQHQAPTPQQRRDINEHPARSAEILQVAGITDMLWLGVVRTHHAAPEPGAEEQAQTPTQRLAHLLLRADIFTAKLSRRRSRDGKSGAIAARDACLNASGQLDDIGATMLRVLGLYPPGSCVEMANGELAVVTRRGHKAHMPVVVAVRRADGSVLVNPKRRECSDPQYRVNRAVRPEELNMVLQHDRLLACG